MKNKIGLCVKNIWIFFFVFLLCDSCSEDDDCDLNNLHGESITIKDSLNLCFMAIDNPVVLQEDVYGKFCNDSVISFHIPYVVESKVLIPNFDDRYQVFVGDQQIFNGETKVDFSEPVQIHVFDKNYNQQTFTIYTSSFTGLPQFFITTENNIPITSNIDYVNATLRVLDNMAVRSVSGPFESKVKIRVRGNTTASFDKKPYKLHFDKKTSVLGLPADKKWVLLANYTDKTALRNELAFHLGRISNLEYTCRTRFVEVFVNDNYMGNYQLGEQQEISKNRVNLPSDGVLLEIDYRATSDDCSFNVSSISCPICIKDPDILQNSPEYINIVDAFKKVESSLFGENYKDEQEGYAKYLDVASFVDWYLINEIAKNNDACFFSSCYMNFVPGGKLKMGPIWDFDIAFGNVNYNNNERPNGFWIKDVYWFRRLFTDPKFVEQVKNRFDFFYTNQDWIFNQINEDANLLKYSVIENNNKWHTLYQYTWPNFAIWGSYENEIQYLKSWLRKRMEWLKIQYDMM